MKPGDVVLVTLLQADERMKIRPALVLKVLLPFRDFLVCGISTQLRQEVAGFDEVIRAEDSDFASSGLRKTSLIRLGYLATMPEGLIRGVMGKISRTRLEVLQRRLSDFLVTQTG